MFRTHSGESPLASPEDIERLARIRHAEEDRMLVQPTAKAMVWGAMIADGPAVLPHDLVYVARQRVEEITGEHPALHMDNTSA